MINDYFIKIDKCWFDENTNLYNLYGEYGLILYCSILQGKTIRDYCKFNIYSDLYSLLEYNTNANRTQINRFNSTLVDMCNDKIFEVYTMDDIKMENDFKLSNMNYKIYVNDNIANIPKELTVLYSTILDDNFKKVIKYKDKSINVLKLFAYYCYISYITNCKDYYCKKGMDYICVGSKLSKSTVIRYNSILSDKLDLIKYCPSGSFNAKDLKESTNFYCMIENFDNMKVRMEQDLKLDYNSLKIGKMERDLKRKNK